RVGLVGFAGEGSHSPFLGGGWSAPAASRSQPRNRAGESRLMSTTQSTTPSDRDHLQPAGGRARREGARPKGLSIERVFTKAGADHFGAVAWELRSAKITGEGGEVVFEQKDVEIPKSWSQLAAN